MRIIKTAKFNAYAATLLQFPWKTSLKYRIDEALQSLEPDPLVKNNLSPYEQNERVSDEGKQEIIRDVIFRWAENEAPPQVKAGGDMLPEFKGQVRSFIESQYGVDPFFGEPIDIPDWTDDQQTAE